jgi:hypothetical protein
VASRIAVAHNKGIPILPPVMPQRWRSIVLGDGKLKRKTAKARAMWLAS